MNQKFCLGEFELLFSKMDEGLLIQAEDTRTGSVFSTVLNQGSAKALSSEHRLDIDTIFELLNGYFEQKPEKTLLSITKEGTLSYSCQVQLGSLTKQMSFDIHLEKQNLEPITKVEKLVNKLLFRVYELENTLQTNNGRSYKQEIEAFTKSNDERFFSFEKLMLAKFEGLEKALAKTNERIEALEAKIQKNDKEIASNNNLSSVDWIFNPSSPFAAQFILSNGNKTALSKTTETYSIFAQNSVPKTGKSEVTFLIQNPSNNYLFVGITSETARSREQCFLDGTTFGLTYHGNIFKYGTSNSGFPTYADGDKVSFSFDMENCAITVSVNNKEAYVHSIPKEAISLYNFYPCICTGGNKAIGATFI